MHRPCCHVCAKVAPFTWLLPMTTLTSTMCCLQLPPTTTAHPNNNDNVATWPAQWTNGYKMSHHQSNGQTMNDDDSQQATSPAQQTWWLQTASHLTSPTDKWQQWTVSHPTNRWTTTMDGNQLVNGHATMSRQWQHILSSLSINLGETPLPHMRTKGPCYWLLQTFPYELYTTADTYIFLRRSLDHPGQTLDTHPMTHSYFLWLDYLDIFLLTHTYIDRVIWLLCCHTSPKDSLRHSMTLMTLHKSYRLILLTCFWLVVYPGPQYIRRVFLLVFGSLNLGNTSLVHPHVSVGTPVSKFTLVL